MTHGGREVILKTRNDERFEGCLKSMVFRTKDQGGSARWLTPRQKSPAAGV